MKIAFTIFGEPFGKGRPRMTKKGFAYTPAKTRKKENDFLVQALSSRPDKPLGSYLSVTITAFFSIPESKSKKWKAAALACEIRPDKTPDIDNVVKGILDPLNSIFFNDDKQVVELHASKFYSDIPRVEVAIEEIVHIPMSKEGWSQ